MLPKQVNKLRKAKQSSIQATSCTSWQRLRSKFWLIFSCSGPAIPRVVNHVSSTCPNKSCTQDRKFIDDEVDASSQVQFLGHSDIQLK